MILNYLVNLFNNKEYKEFIDVFKNINIKVVGENYIVFIFVNILVFNYL